MPVAKILSFPINHTFKRNSAATKCKVNRQFYWASSRDVSSFRMTPQILSRSTRSAIAKFGFVKDIDSLRADEMPGIGIPVGIALTLLVKGPRLGRASGA